MTLPRLISTLIVGGGPAGIVSLKYTIEYGEAWSTDEEPLLIEMEPEIGGTFRWRGYQNAELVSSKQLTCFSDFRYPLDSPDHPSLPNFVEYLNRYIDNFNLRHLIRTSTKLISLDYASLGSKDLYKHQATIQPLDDNGLPQGEPLIVLAKRVIITTGLHVTPNIPLIPGLNSTPCIPEPPKWIHSSAYKSRDQLQGKKVLVLGCGETGMDVGYEAIMAPAKKVWLGVRTGFLSFPKLFETAYVHPWVAASHIRWFISDLVIKRVLWVLTGTMAGCNQWAGELPPDRQGRAYVFLNKSAKAMQFINRPFYSLSPIHRWFAHYIDPPSPPGDPKIDIVPFPQGFDFEGRAVFPAPPEHRRKETAWKYECKPDLVVLCTGYRQDWSWLGEGYPRGPEDCEIRGITSAKDPSVAFIGFVRPGVGAIPPIAEMQAQLFLLLAEKRIPIPVSPETYHLLHSPTSRIQYGVDYSTYMSTLAKDIGSAPGLLKLWWEYGWFVLFVYCFGAAFPTFYRLTGPFKVAKAKGIVETELWDTIKRRGVIGNIFMGVIPMVFYACLNLGAYVLEFVWKVVTPIFDLPVSPLEFFQEKSITVKSK
ncbi:dimethylaniline monooxygenase [Cryptococcus deuterogattii 99/473]|uniref:Dimethylaniline monooxygenase n=1 Tax=Cryptococcus deuterogattii Ram5 TaxID=1296110 RepID=A0A0D0T729_9TREE|nr:dimethylaniline monooxygenase [Cryptococcus deuterogattii LA55]KIR33534.1 dimethylaniline monooxygenase [Cryptococcus deuterogattii MMRL2647]KIR41722.1 dimethylaniline monooxygenase [Cryptococcus deuterogattii Ram5]KIR73453.1 dimethylaniline monooxygenase [Cryptococcus deuterogattii CA1014]KIR91788.1 dimethylaniline monooxygenase [Cryptococcus deuterogattii CBS 10090]KIY60164.1 dimethylaniline monooxygenase [Cryptococcus deuterogattii 99/473]